MAANKANLRSYSMGSDVPQGTVLGPLVFLVYANDLPNNIASSVCLFADNCVIYWEIKSASEVSVPQPEINQVSKWCKLRHTKFITNKGKHMSVS